MVISNGSFLTYYPTTYRKVNPHFSSVKAFPELVSWREATTPRSVIATIAISYLDTLALYFSFLWQSVFSYRDKTLFLIAENWELIPNYRY